MLQAYFDKIIFVSKPVNFERRVADRGGVDPGGVDPDPYPTLKKHLKTSPATKRSTAAWGDPIYLLCCRSGTMTS